jgi:hypothetical protein
MGHPFRILAGGCHRARELDSHRTTADRHRILNCCAGAAVELVELRNVRFAEQLRHDHFTASHRCRTGKHGAESDERPTGHHHAIAIGIGLLFIE